VSIRRPDGFALIDLLFVIGIIGVLSIIALPKLLLAKQAAGAASAIGSLRSVNSAQLTFALTCGAGFYAPNLTTLGMAPAGSPEAFISPNLATGDTVMRAGYTIQLKGVPYAGAPSSCNGLAAGAAAQGFKAAADPNQAENKRYFATNSNGQMYEHNGSLWAIIGESGEPPAGHLLH
jgi:type IV pilus assembly protein PilA